MIRFIITFLAVFIIYGFPPAIGVSIIVLWLAWVIIKYGSSEVKNARRKRT